MDLSKFNDPTFDVKDWINAAFKSPAAEKHEKKDVYAAQVVTKLQFLIKEANRALEDSSNQVVTNVTRVLRDVDTVKQEAALLKSQMESVHEQIESVESETQHSMQVLVELDKVKSRVEAAKGALEEANKWSALVALTEEKFSENDVKGVAESLEAMKASLIVLREAPDYDDKHRKLEDLKNKMEMWLNPLAQDVFNKHDTKQAGELIIYFTKIDRLVSLERIYGNCRRRHYNDEWDKLFKRAPSPGQADSPRSPTPEAQLLDSSKEDKLLAFYDLLHEAKTKESDWLNKIFDQETSKKLATNLVSKTCEVLQSQIENLITREVNSCEDNVEALNVLTIKCAHVYKFVENLELEPTESELIDPILAPYTSHLYSFGKMIQQKLFIELNSVQIEDENFIDSLHKFQNSVDRIFAILFSALNICEDLTGGLAIEECLSACNEYLLKYAQKASMFLRSLKKKWKVGASDTNKETSYKNILSEDEAWRAFSDSMQLISVTGNLLTQIDEANENICTDIMNIGEKFFKSETGFMEILSKQELGSNSQNNNSNYCYNYLNEKDFQSLQSLCANIHATVHAADEHDTLANNNDYQKRLPLYKARNEFLNLNQAFVQLAYELVVTQVRANCCKIPILEKWADPSATEGLMDDMPSLGIIPLEYITSIGDFIVTLPQHLEVLHDVEVEEMSECPDPGLFKALSSCKLPNLDINQNNMQLSGLTAGTETTTQSRIPSTEIYSQITVYGGAEWLESLVRKAENLLVMSYLKIPVLTDSAGVQLKSDIDYMSNVTNSLGIESLKALQNIGKLAVVEREDFSASTVDCSAKVVSGIAKMRRVNLEK